jgi:hypothetical protein
MPVRTQPWVERIDGRLVSSRITQAVGDAKPTRAKRLPRSTAGAPVFARWSTVTAGRRLDPSALPASYAPTLARSACGAVWAAAVIHVCRRDSRSVPGPECRRTSPEETPRLPGPGDGSWVRSPGVSRRHAAKRSIARGRMACRREYPRPSVRISRLNAIEADVVAGEPRHAAKRSTARRHMAGSVPLRPHPWVQRSRQSQLWERARRTPIDRELGRGGAPRGACTASHRGPGPESGPQRPRLSQRNKNRARN